LNIMRLYSIGKPGGAAAADGEDRNQE